MNNEQQRLYALTEYILGLMQENKGSISFVDWMQAALYAPKLGYYESEEIFGQQGDFTTGTAMGSWLALGYADNIYQSWQALGKPNQWVLIEQGGGNGDLMCDILDALQTLHLKPSQTFAVETSEQLRQRQTDNYQRRGFDITVISSLQQIPQVENAVMYSNELPDAFPVQVFTYKNKQSRERGVDWDGQKFIWADLKPLELPIAAQIQEQWLDHYISEYNPYLISWQQDVSNVFERGVVLTVDYGYTQREYYRTQRMEGTLMGHYQHQVVEDVLKLSPGVCDITAHVDFSALKQAGELAGLTSIAYTTQGAWLAQSQSVQQQLQNLATNPSAENIAQVTHAKRLMLPSGMGESFKLLVQSKGINQESSQTLITPAFDRLHTL